MFELCRAEREKRLGKRPGPPLQLTEKRKSAIRARLREGFTVADLKRAAAGFYADTWKQRDKHLDPIHCFKDDEKVRTWMAAHRNSPGRPSDNLQETTW